MPDSNNTSGMEHGHPESHSVSIQTKEVPSLPALSSVESGYFMLDTENPALSVTYKDHVHPSTSLEYEVYVENDREYCTVPSSRRKVYYENVSLNRPANITDMDSRTDNRKYKTDEGKETGQANASPSYVNVPNNSNAMSTDNTEHIHVTESTNEMRLQDSYDDSTSVRPRITLSPTPDSSSTHNTTPTSYATTMERPEVRRSPPSRSRHVYEVVPIMTPPSTTADVGGASLHDNTSDSGTYTRQPLQNIFSYIYQVCIMLCIDPLTFLWVTSKVCIHLILYVTFCRCQH